MTSTDEIARPSPRARAKADFLRPPRSAGEWAADAVRVLGVIGVAVAAIAFRPTDAGIAALALPAVVAPRILGLRAWFDVSLGITVLAAAWSNVLGLYTAIPGWDLLLHFACTGVLAILVATMLTRSRVVAITRDGPRRTPLVLLPLIALAISAVWEMIEWLGWAFVSGEIFVAYEDTIGDMAFGGIGGIVAGLVLARTAVERD